MFFTCTSLWRGTGLTALIDFAVMFNSYYEYISTYWIFQRGPIVYPFVCSLSPRLTAVTSYCLAARAKCRVGELQESSKVSAEPRRPARGCVNSLSCPLAADHSTPRLSRVWGWRGATGAGSEPSSQWWDEAACPVRNRQNICRS